MKPSYRLVRLAESMARTGLGRSAFYAAISDGVLPKPIKLGRASAWPEHELNSVVAAMIRGESQDALRDLVQRLHDERAHCGRDAAVPA
jgi:prophage regulatory protein